MTTKSAAAGKRAAQARGDPALQVLRRFRTVFSSVRSHFRTVELKVGVSGAQVWALGQVAAHPGMGIRELAAAMDVAQPTASNLVRALLAAGLVTSEKGETDRRAVRLHATARGLKLLARAPAPFSGILPDALRRLDDATLARLDRDLARLIRELKADSGMAQVLIVDED